MDLATGWRRSAARKMCVRENAGALGAAPPSSRGRFSTTAAGAVRPRSFLICRHRIAGKRRRTRLPLRVRPVRADRLQGPDRARTTSTEEILVLHQQRPTARAHRPRHRSRAQRARGQCVRGGFRSRTRTTPGSCLPRRARALRTPSRACERVSSCFRAPLGATAARRPARVPACSPTLVLRAHSPALFVARSTSQPHGRWRALVTRAMAPRGRFRPR